MMSPTFLMTSPNILPMYKIVLVLLVYFKGKFFKVKNILYLLGHYLEKTYCHEGRYYLLLSYFHGLQCFMFVLGRWTSCSCNKTLLTHCPAYPLPPPLTLFKPISPYFQSYHLIYIIRKIW